MLIQIAYVFRVPLSELVPGARPMELAWEEGSSPLPQAVDAIAQTIAQRPDLMPQVLEFLSLLVERETHVSEEL